MHQRSSLAPIFFFSLGVVLFIFALGWLGLLGFVGNSIQNVFFPLGAFVHTEEVVFINKPNELTRIQQENAHLREQLVALKQLQSDNAALRDQFQTISPSPQHLLPVHVVGMPNVVPNVTFPESLIIDAGKKEGVKLGFVVVVKNELIGFVAATSDHFTTVKLLTSTQSNFSAFSVNTQARGIVHGQGNGIMLFSNVLLSDTLQVGDTVVTSGGQNMSGVGFPPNYVVGKIVSVNKNPSSLFQDAKVVPLIAFDRLQHVFVLMQ